LNKKEFPSHLPRNNIYMTFKCKVTKNVIGGMRAEGIISSAVCNGGASAFVAGDGTTPFDERDVGRRIVWSGWNKEFTTI